jgi:hypothetical protein
MTLPDHLGIHIGIADGTTLSTALYCHTLHGSQAVVSLCPIALRTAFAGLDILAVALPAMPFIALPRHWGGLINKHVRKAQPAAPSCPIFQALQGNSLPATAFWTEVSSQ